LSPSTASASTARGAEQASAGNDFIVPAFEAIPKWGAQPIATTGLEPAAASAYSAASRARTSSATAAARSVFETGQ
jgi:hypothetical protein